MREAGVFVEGAITCGHSVGEYNALAAVTGILPLEALLEIVFRRGMAMHHLVPRDAHGRSNYRLAAIRPSQIDLADDDVTAFVAEVAEECGEFIQIVNYNLRGSQYAIAGTVAGLEALETVVEERRARVGGKPAFILVPGIDVPFHSSELHAGVDDFRARLDDLLPETIDPSLLIGRYIPNLVPRLFTLDRVLRRGDRVVRRLAAPHAGPRGLGDLGGRPGPPRPRRADRAARVAVRQPRALDRDPGPALRLAPEQDGLGIEQFVEVGVANAPTLANLAAQTTKLATYEGVAPRIVNSSRDEAVVFATDTPHVDDEPEAEPETTEASDGAARGDKPRRPPRGRPDGGSGRRASGRPHLRRRRRDPHPGRAADQGAARPDRHRRHDRGAVRRRLLAPQPAARRPRGRALARCHRRRRRGRLELPVGHGDQAGPHLQPLRPGAHRGDQRAAPQVRRRRRRQAVRRRRPGQGHLAARRRLGRPRLGRAGRRRARRLLHQGRVARLRRRARRPRHASWTTRSRPSASAQGVQVSLPAAGGGEGATVDVGRARRAHRRRSPARTACSPPPPATCSASSGSTPPPPRSRRTSTPSWSSSSRPSSARTGPARWRRPSTPAARSCSTTAGPRSARTSPAPGPATRPCSSAASPVSTAPPSPRPAGGWTGPAPSSAPTWSPSTAT